MVLQDRKQLGGQNKTKTTRSNVCHESSAVSPLTQTKAKAAIVKRNSSQEVTVHSNFCCFSQLFIRNEMLPSVKRIPQEGEVLQVNILWFLGHSPKNLSRNLLNYFYWMLGKLFLFFLNQPRRTIQLALPPTLPRFILCVCVFCLHVSLSTTCLQCPRKPNVGVGTPNWSNRHWRDPSVGAGK